MSESMNSYALLEAVLFAQGQPVKLSFLAKLSQMDEAQTELALLSLQKRYEGED